jgi:hypothetical protein
VDALSALLLHGTERGPLAVLAAARGARRDIVHSGVLPINLSGCGSPLVRGRKGTVRNDSASPDDMVWTAYKAVLSSDDGAPCIACLEIDPLRSEIAVSRSNSTPKLRVSAARVRWIRRVRFEDEDWQQRLHDPNLPWKWAHEEKDMAAEQCDACGQDRWAQFVVCREDGSLCHRICEPCNALLQNRCPVPSCGKACGAVRERVFLPAHRPFSEPSGLSFVYDGKQVEYRFGATAVAEVMDPQLHPQCRPGIHVCLSPHDCIPYFEFAFVPEWKRRFSEREKQDIGPQCPFQRIDTSGGTELVRGRHATVVLPGRDLGRTRAITT